MTRRRTMLVPVLVLTMVLLGGGVVSAVHCIAGTNCLGTDGPETLKGTTGTDFIVGYDGADLLVGGDGNDFINAQEFSLLNPGVDTVKGGDGGDVIYAEDVRKDFIDCGRGGDEVYFDKDRDIVTNCEIKHPRV